MLLPDDAWYGTFLPVSGGGGQTTVGWICRSLPQTTHQAPIPHFRRFCTPSLHLSKHVLSASRSASLLPTCLGPNGLNLLACGVKVRRVCRKFFPKTNSGLDVSATTRTTRQHLFGLASTRGAQTSSRISNMHELAAPWASLTSNRYTPKLHHIHRQAQEGRLRTFKATIVAGMPDIF